MLQALLARWGRPPSGQCLPGLRSRQSATSLLLAGLAPQTIRSVLARRKRGARRQPRLVAGGPWHEVVAEHGEPELFVAHINKVIEFIRANGIELLIAE